MTKQITVLSILITSIINAQTLKGKISNLIGEPIPFANVIIKDSSIGTTTDENGVYQLEVLNPKIVVIVSSVGYSSIKKKHL